MKKSFVMAMAMVMAVAANAESVSKKSKAPKIATYAAEAAEKMVDNEGRINTTIVDAFEVAEINIPARIRVIEGNEYGVNVIALDKTAEKAVRYTVKNGVLRVFSKAAQELENNTVVINLVVPTAPEIKTASNLDKYSIR